MFAQHGRLTVLANRLRFLLPWNRSDFRQARLRDLSKPRAEAIEPTLDADGGDRKIANRGIVNPFDAGVPRGDARRRQCFFRAAVSWR